MGGVGHRPDGDESGERLIEKVAQLEQENEELKKENSNLKLRNKYLVGRYEGIREKYLEDQLHR